MSLRTLLMGAACALVPCAASAATWILQFSGPQSGTFSIRDFDTATPYVSDFMATGLEGYTAVPSAISPSWASTAPSTNGGARSMLSTVNLSSTGGDIRIGPSMWYEGYYDGGINLHLTYTLSSPEAVGADFTDDHITGSYTFDYYVNAQGHGGAQDIYQRGSGVFSGVIAHDPPDAVPEPAAWASMILGMLMIGVAMRRRGWLDSQGSNLGPPH